MDVDQEQLQRSVEGMHHCKARLAQSVPVSEAFEGKAVWEGVMHVFDLAASCGDPRVRLVIGDRGKHETTVLRRGAYRTD